MFIRGGLYRTMIWWPLPHIHDARGDAVQQLLGRLQISAHHDKYKRDASACQRVLIQVASIQTPPHSYYVRTYNCWMMDHIRTHLGRVTSWCHLILLWFKNKNVCLFYLFFFWWWWRTLLSIINRRACGGASKEFWPLFVRTPLLPPHHTIVDFFIFWWYYSSVNVVWTAFLFTPFGGAGYSFILSPLIVISQVFDPTEHPFLFRVCVIYSRQKASI